MDADTPKAPAYTPDKSSLRSSIVVVIELALGSVLAVGDGDISDADYE